MAYQGKFEKLCRSSKAAGEDNDCAVKAVAIACRTDYGTAWRTLAGLGRRRRCGTPLIIIARALNSLGFKIAATEGYTGPAGQCPTVVNLSPTLTRGYYLVSTRDHILAVVNGEAMDWSKDKRLRVREVWKIERRKSA